MWMLSHLYTNGENWGRVVVQSKGHRVIPVVTDMRFTESFTDDPLNVCRVCPAPGAWPAARGFKELPTFSFFHSRLAVDQEAFFANSDTVQERGCRFIGGSRHEVPRLRCFWILKLLLQFCFCFFDHFYFQLQRSGSSFWSVCVSANREFRQLTRSHLTITLLWRYCKDSLHKNWIKRRKVNSRASTAWGLFALSVATGRRLKKS